MSRSLAKHAPTRACLSETWVRRAEQLLHDQCWCWGRDVERPEGNLLVEFGFRRVPSPEGRTFAYDLDRAGERVILAGAGLCYAAPGSTQAALLGRYDVRPRLLPRGEIDTAQWATVGASVFQSTGARDETSSTSRLLLTGAVQWIGAYEAWVRRIAGVDYRNACLASWPRASVVADRIVEEWEALLAELEAAHRDGDEQSNQQRSDRRDSRD